MKSSFHRLVHHRSISFRLLALALCVAPMGGCAVLNDGNDAFAQGWRRAKVVSLRTPNTLPDGSHFECQGESAPTTVNAHWAIASYSVAGSPNVRNLRAVAVPEDASLRVGETVLINVRSCQVSLRKMASGSAG